MRRDARKKVVMKMKDKYSIKQKLIELWIGSVEEKDPQTREVIASEYRALLKEFKNMDLDSEFIGFFQAESLNSESCLERKAS